MSRLDEISDELKKLWTKLSRQELCEYYEITDRTLYNYQNKLGLPKKGNEKLSTVTNPIVVFMNKSNNETKKQVFKNWEHFVIWSKAQSYSYRIISSNEIHIDYSKKL